MKQYSLYAFDLDGVLFRGNEAIPGAAEAVSAIRKRAQVRFLTNNSTQTRASFADKLISLGFEARQSEIYSSAAGTAMLLAESSAYVVGEGGLRDELRAVDCKVDVDDAEWVVVGACWSLTYAMLDEAQWRIRNGARYLATNLDKTYPIEGGRVKPGAGAIVAAVSAASEREPEIVVGKPAPTLMIQMFAETGIAADGCVLVGDRLDTDIECAHRAGCDSVLVLTGVTQKVGPASATPTAIIASVAELQ